jgi:hypothetical protein
MILRPLLKIGLSNCTNFTKIAQQNARDLRAAMVAIPVIQTSTDLARARAHRCEGDCPMLKVRRARLAAEVEALTAEADEAKRREASEDRRNSLADRIDELRATLRVDQVAFSVASWLGTTEHCVELIIGFAYAVVLEGAAVMGRMLVVTGLGRDAGRNAIGSDRAPGTPNRDPAIPIGSSGAVLSEDDQFLARIHAAVVAGELKPTQHSIRKFLRCGQPRAGNLNRYYVARFGSVHA